MSIIKYINVNGKNFCTHPINTEPVTFKFLVKHKDKIHFNTMTNRRILMLSIFTQIDENFIKDNTHSEQICIEYFNLEAKSLHARQTSASVANIQ